MTNWAFLRFFKVGPRAEGVKSAKSPADPLRLGLIALRYPLFTRAGAGCAAGCPCPCCCCGGGGGSGGAAEARSGRGRPHCTARVSAW